jgi:hypothetical protein
MRKSATLQPGSVLQKLCSQQRQICGEFINTHSIRVFKIVGLVDAVAFAGKTDDAYTQEQAVYKIALLVLGLQDPQPEIARILFNYEWEDVRLRARPIMELTPAARRDLLEAREDVGLSIPAFVRPPVRGKRVRRPKELSSSLQGADAQCAMDLERERRRRHKIAQPAPAEDRPTGETMPEPELAAD